MHNGMLPVPSLDKKTKAKLSHQVQCGHFAKGLVP